MKKKISVILLSLGLIFGFGVAAPVVTAAPAQAATWYNSLPGLNPTMSSCHNHYKVAAVIGNYRERWCYFSFRAYDRWAYGYKNGWYHQVQWSQRIGWHYAYSWDGPDWHTWHPGY